MNETKWNIGNTKFKFKEVAAMVEPAAFTPNNGKIDERRREKQREKRKKKE